MSKTEEEILAREEQIRMADASPEPDTSTILDNLLDDDVLMIGPQGQRFTKAFLLEAHRPPKKAAFDSVVVSDLAIKELGNTVVVSCRATFTSQGQSFALRCTRVWHRQHSEWKIVAGTVTLIPAEGS
jgi:ketosteroid isomerase-like protein